MEKSKPLPEFGTTQELVDYFDTHDMGDHWEQMPEAHFEVILEKICLVAVDGETVSGPTAGARQRRRR